MDITMVCIDPSVNARKFWKAHVLGSTVHCSWGRIGKTEVQQSFRFDGDVRAAVKYFHKKVNEKYGKGYERI